MNNVYKNILFDLDGTLTDPKEGITNSVAYALKRYGIAVENKDELTAFIGPPLIYSFCTFYGFDEDKAEQAVDVYREYFTERGIFENSVYNGIPQLLDKLKQQGKRLFIATSKPEVFAVKIARHFGFFDKFCAVRGIPLDGERMSKSDVIAQLMREFELSPEDTVMVGDRRYDVEGAAQNGLRCIGVLYGYGDRSELESAGVWKTADSVKELAEITESL